MKELKLKKEVFIIINKNEIFLRFKKFKIYADEICMLIN